MKSNIIFNNHESNIFADLNSGDTMMLMRVLKEQPDDEYSFDEIYDNIAYFESDHDTCWKVPLQYPVGKYGVRETWRVIKIYPSMKEMLIEYKDGNRRLIKILTKIETLPSKGSLYAAFATFVLQPENSNWRSPATMPKEAIRDHVIVESNTVKRVGELTFDEICVMFELTPISQEAIRVIKVRFIEYFNSLYANPRKWKNGYVCYVWDWKSFHELYGDNINLGYEDYDAVLSHSHKGIIDVYEWKGKPLTIYPNPYLELFTARIE